MRGQTTTQDLKIKLTGKNRCRLDLTGLTFGRLTVILFAGSKKDGSTSRRARWKCKCLCGNTIITASNDLVRGHTKSCGCWKDEANSSAHLIHGHAKSSKKVGRQRTRTYVSFESAKSRCNNSNDPSYGHYGGRGIKFLFSSFQHFLATLGERPIGHTLDRFPDNDGNYEPGNVRWATYKQQAVNRRIPK
jgi:hypothetical protein